YAARAFQSNEVEILTRALPDTSPGRAARIRKDPAIRSEEIISAACRLFVQEGATAFNLRRVAALSGIRLSTLQHHFPSRESLLTETFDRLVGDLVIPITRLAADSSQAPEHRLKTLSELSIRYFSEARTADFLSEIFALGQQDQFVKDLLGRHYQAFEDAFVVVLKDVNSACPAPRLRDMAIFIATQLQGLMLFVRRETAAVDSSTLVSQQLDQLLALTLGMIRE